MSAATAKAVWRTEDFFARLGLGEEEPRWSQRWADLASRRIGFDWAHAGLSSVRVASVFEAIRATPELRPLRTGHLGNWGAIASGCAGAMDFNATVTRAGLAEPCVYAFNRTESDGVDAGDWVYMPASRIERGVRERLPVRTWNGSRFEDRDASVPRFVPLVKTVVEGVEVPLLRAQWRRALALDDLPMNLEVDALLADEARIVALIETILEAARRQPNPRVALQEVVGHVVHLDGTMQRAAVVPTENGGFDMNGRSFRNGRELAMAIVETLAIARDPEAFFDRIDAVMAPLPFLANTAARILSAAQGSHLRSAEARRGRRLPADPHVHWGARDMAGYPPVRRGYFGKRPTIKALEWMGASLVAAHDDFDPVFFVLLPVTIFMLWPSSAYPSDAAGVDALVARMLDARGSLSRQPEVAIPHADRIVRGWLDEFGPRMSSYFLERFPPRRSVLPPTIDHDVARALEPREFGLLTMREACLLVGALVRALGVENGDEG